MPIMCDTGLSKEHCDIIISHIFCNVKEKKIRFLSITYLSYLYTSFIYILLFIIYNMNLHTYLTYINLEKYNLL